MVVNVENPYHCTPPHLLPFRGPPLSSNTGSSSVASASCEPSHLEGLMHAASVWNVLIFSPHSLFLPLSKHLSFGNLPLLILRFSLISERPSLPLWPTQKCRFPFTTLSPFHFSHNICYNLEIYAYFVLDKIYHYFCYPSFCSPHHHILEYSCFFSVYFKIAVIPSRSWCPEETLVWRMKFRIIFTKIKFKSRRSEDIT